MSSITIRNDASLTDYTLDEIKFPRRVVDLGVVQMSMTSSTAENLHTAELLVREAASNLTGEHRVVLLPELFAYRYFPADPSGLVPRPESLTGPIAQCCSQWAKDLGIVLVAGSLFESDGTSINEQFNTTPVFGTDGALIGSSRKIHIPNDPGFLEQQFFSKRPCEQPIETIKTPFGEIGAAICFDQWFPVVAQILGNRGAKMIFFPTAIASVDSIQQQEGSWSEAWKLANRARAQETRTIVAVANRVGREGSSQFFGRSLIIDAFGAVLVEGDPNREQVLLSKVNLAHGEFIDRAWGFSASERLVLYQQLLQSVEARPNQ